LRFFHAQNATVLIDVKVLFEGPLLLEKEAGVLRMVVALDPGRFIAKIVVGPREEPWVAKLFENVFEQI